MKRRFEPIEELITFFVFEVGVDKNTEDVFQALSKETFASDGFGHLAGCP